MKTAFSTPPAVSGRGADTIPRAVPPPQPPRRGPRGGAGVARDREEVVVLGGVDDLALVLHARARHLPVEGRDHGPVLPHGGLVVDVDGREGCRAAPPLVVLGPHTVGERKPAVRPSQ